MDASVEQQLRTEFWQAALDDVRERRLAEEWYHEQIRHRQEQNARREEDDDRVDDLHILIQAVTLATAQQVAAFRAGLDVYDAAVIETLLDNRRALERTRAAIDEMLVRAHTLPDGTRVFVTEDGEQVFDENGADVTNVIAPEEIDPSRPRWEIYRDALAEQAALESERAELLDFQARLDEARDQLAEGGVSADALDDMRDALETDMPEAVRARLHGPESAAAPEPDGNAEPSPQIDMDALRQDLAGAASPAAEM